MEINDRIKQVRIKLGMSRRVFADKMNYMHGYLTDVETDTEPDDRFIRKLCSVYGIDEQWLRTGVDLKVVSLKDFGDALEKVVINAENVTNEMISNNFQAVDNIENVKNNPYAQNIVYGVKDKSLSCTQLVLVERARTVQLQYKMSDAEVAGRLGISVRHVKAVDNCLCLISETFLRLLINIFNLDERWLFTGEGEMFVSGVAPKRNDVIGFGGKDKDKDINARLDTYMMFKNIKATELAWILGVSNTVALRIKHGYRSLTDEWVDKICKSWGISKSWLLRGKGHPRALTSRNTRTKVEKKPRVDSYSQEVPTEVAVEIACSCKNRSVIEQTAAKYTNKGDSTLDVLQRLFSAANGDCVLPDNESPKEVLKYWS